MAHGLLLCARVYFFLLWENGVTLLGPAWFNLLPPYCNQNSGITRFYFPCCFYIIFYFPRNNILVVDTVLGLVQKQRIIGVLLPPLHLLLLLFGGHQTETDGPFRIFISLFFSFGLALPLPALICSLLSINLFLFISIFQKKIMYKINNNADGWMDDDDRVCAVSVSVWPASDNQFPSDPGASLGRSPCFLPFLSPSSPSSLLFLLLLFLFNSEAAVLLSCYFASSVWNHIPLNKKIQDKHFLFLHLFFPLHPSVHPPLVIVPPD